MERAEIAQLFYNVLINLDEVEKLDRFLSSRVQWTLSAADPQTVGEEAPPNAIAFSGKEGCRQLALYFQENLIKGVFRRSNRLYCASSTGFRIRESAISCIRFGPVRRNNRRSKTHISRLQDH
jgi:hypothetical protein